MAKIVLEIDECIECPFMRGWCCSKHENGNQEIPRSGRDDEPIKFPVPEWCPIRIDNKPKILEAIAKDWGSETDEHWEEI